MGKIRPAILVRSWFTFAKLAIFFNQGNEIFVGASHQLRGICCHLVVSCLCCFCIFTQTKTSYPYMFICPSKIQRISFYCRSLFVPYFKFLLDGCVQHLVHADDTKTGMVPKKKTKLQEKSNNSEEGDVGFSLELWHLRALILSSLHKCFLYDIGNLKFLDSSNFQARSSLPYY